MSVVDRVQLEFGATIINDHPFTEKACSVLIEDAIRLIQEDADKVAQGTHIEQWTRQENKGKYLRPVPVVVQSPSNSKSNISKSSPMSTPSRKSRSKGKILEEVNFTAENASPSTSASASGSANPSQYNSADVHYNNKEEKPKKSKKNKHLMNSSTSSLDSDYADMHTQYNSKSCLIL